MSSSVYPILGLPREIQSRILHFCFTKPLHLSSCSAPVVQTELPLAVSILRRANSFLLEEADRHFLESWKTFSTLSDFPDVHITMQWGTHFLLQVKRAEPRRLNFGLDFMPKFIGLEKVILDFTSEDYIAFFDVMLPPFDSTSWSTPLSGAARHLVHTRHLVLRFGERFADPWYNCEDPRWTDEEHEAPPTAWAPRFRQNTCSHGLLIDWILSFAWANRYLQHLDSVTLEGNVQAKVLDKWTKIFSEDSKDRKNEYSPDIQAITERGLAAAKEASKAAAKAAAEAANQTWDPLDWTWNPSDWNPADHYAPVCECAVKCDVLRYRKLEDDTEEALALQEKRRAEMERVWWQAAAQEKWTPVTNEREDEKLKGLRW